jgi:hypothetical protein
MIIWQDAHVIWLVKTEIQSSNDLLCKQGSTHLYRHVYSMQVRFSTKLELNLFLNCDNVNKAHALFTFGRFTSAISHV